MPCTTLLKFSFVFYCILIIFLHFFTIILIFFFFYYLQCDVSILFYFFHETLTFVPFFFYFLSWNIFWSIIFYNIFSLYIGYTKDIIIISIKNNFPYRTVKHGIQLLRIIEFSARFTHVNYLSKKKKSLQCW